MIRKVLLRRFKRFSEVTFDLPDHLVVVGPNNSGKTTLLQAIAAWDLALRRWKELADPNRHKGAYTWCPIARQAFAAVSMRRFDFLWRDRSTGDAIEIEVWPTGCASPITMEFKYDSTEQISVRPKVNGALDPATERQRVDACKVTTAFVPPMTGIAREEPEYARPETINELLAQGRPGEVLRNLLLTAHRDALSWRALTEAIRRLFTVELFPPAQGAFIAAEYRTLPGGPRLDIASAGSGFQQVLMLLTFLHTRPGAVLLLDEPDAHLHVFLQDAIFAELKQIAAAKDSQLILATHSEVITNAVELDEVCVLLDQPRRLTDGVDRNALNDALRVLDTNDIVQAQIAPGIIYVEGRTDLDILREWATVLDHPIKGLLSRDVYWRPTVVETADGGEGFSSRRHFKALQLVRADMRGVELLDGDGGKFPDKKQGPITGTGLQRLRWSRYEIESYLLHPAALRRFVAHKLGGPEAAADAVKALDEAIERMFQGRALFDAPLSPGEIIETYLQNTKARTKIIPGLLEAAGLHGLSYGSYFEIAEKMLPEEVHPEVKAKLDLLQQALQYA